MAPNYSSSEDVKLEATGQILEYSETYKRGDYYKSNLSLVIVIIDHSKSGVWPQSFMIQIMKIVPKKTCKTNNL